MFSVDWVTLTIIGLIGFLMWHTMMDAPLVSDAVMTVTQKQPQPPLKKAVVEKATTIFAEPGLGGKVIDPLSNVRAVPEESLASTTIGMPIK
jgi:hypothetical protein